MADQTATTEVLNGREVVFWSTSEHECELSCDSILEALHMWFGGLPDGDVIPETVKVFGWARMPKPAVDGLLSTEWGGPLRDLLDGLDIDRFELGNPNEATKPTDAMRDAERVFIEAVLSEYEPWACEVVQTHTVRPILCVDDDGMPVLDSYEYVEG